MVSEGQDADDFVLKFFEGSGSAKGYHILKALAENESLLRDLFAGREFIGELSQVISVYESLLSIQRGSKDYKGFEKAVKKHKDIDAAHLKEKSMLIAMAIERAFSEECSAIEAEATELNLRIPGRMPCGSVNINPSLAGQDYSAILREALRGLLRSKRVRETLLAELRAQFTLYASQIDFDASNVKVEPLDPSGLLNAIYSKVLNQQSIAYLRAVKEHLLRLARYVRELQLIAGPAGKIRSVRLPDFSADTDEFLKSCVRVILCVRKLVKEGSPPPLSTSSDDVKSLKAELASLAVRCSFDERVKSYLRDTTYISDPLFGALFIAPSIMDLESVSRLGERVTSMGPEERERLLLGCISPESAALGLEITMSPDHIVAALELGGAVANLVDKTMTLSKLDADRAFVNLRNYGTAGQLMLSMSRELAVSIKTRLLPVMSIAFPEAKPNVGRLKETAEALSSSSWSNLQKNLLRVLTEMDPIGGMLADEGKFIRTKVVTIISGEGLPSRDLSFSTLAYRLKLGVPSNLESSSEGLFMRYSFGGREVRLAPSADLVFSIIRGGSSLNEATTMLFQAYGLANRERAKELVRLIVNELIRVGLVVPYR